MGWPRSIITNEETKQNLIFFFSFIGSRRFASSYWFCICVFGFDINLCAKGKLDVYGVWIWIMVVVTARESMHDEFIHLKVITATAADDDDDGNSESVATCFRNDPVRCIRITFLPVVCELHSVYTDKLEIVLRSVMFAGDRCTLKHWNRWFYCLTHLLIVHDHGSVVRSIHSSMYSIDFIQFNLQLLPSHTHTHWHSYSMSGSGQDEKWRAGRN